jgi:hypothetical protein
MPIAWDGFHSVAVARTGRGANRSRDLEFRRWYRGFSDRHPSWVRPAGGSKSDCGALALFGFALWIPRTCFYGIPSCRRPRAERAAPLGRSPSRPSGSRCRGRIPRGRHDDLVPGTPDLWRPGMSVILSADHGRTGGRNRVLGRGTCRSSPRTRGSRPFSLAGFLLTQEGAQKNRSACPSPRPLRSQAARSRPAGQPPHRQTLDLGERVGLSATAVRRLAVVGHALDPAE